MKKILLIIITLTNWLLLFSQTVIPLGDVVGNWSISGSPYLIEGDISIPEGDTLSIDPGVEVIFQDHWNFLVMGSLMAIGTSNFPIVFTIIDTTGFSNIQSNDGSWNGIVIDNLYAAEMQTSQLTYCELSFGKKIEDWPNMRGGAVFINGNVDVSITNCKFHHNTAKHGGAIFTREPTRIESNYFSNNRAINTGGAIQASYYNIEIINNIMINNYAGIYGGGAFVSSPYGMFCNNTLVDNLAPEGNSLAISSGEPMYFYNNILWGDLAEGSQVYIDNIQGTTSFYNCNIAGGFDNITGSTGFNFTGEYENNIDIDPNFILSGENPYALSVVSYCANNGTSDPNNIDFRILEFDILENPRIFEDEIDIGAYELQETSNVVISPTISPDGGLYNTAQQVEIENNTPDATIYYTTDGSEPDQSSILYSVPIMISESTILKAKAFKDTYLESLTEEAVFLFGNTISGEISGTLTLENSPYLITGDLEVLENESLIIESGVKLDFTGHYSFRIEGNLYAQGTENDSIYFNAIYENIGWNGISIYSTNIQQEVIFEYCVFSYAKSLESNEDFGGAIYAIDFPTLTVVNCLFEYNLASIGGAIYIENCGGKIGYNIFRNNSSTASGGAIYSGFLSCVDIQNNLFINNFSDFSGGAITYHESQGNLVNNIIKNNYGDYGGGLFISGDNNLDSPILIGNLIYENSSHHKGNAIYIEYFSDVQIVNCTIADNYSESTNNSSAILIYYGCYPTFVNSILWNPGIPEIDIDTGVPSIPMFYNCDVEGGETGMNPNNNGNWFYDCINENPRFIGSGEYPYSLSDDSPIINFGIPDTTGLNLPEYDVAGKPRIYGETIDMGAYEWNGTGTEHNEIPNLDYQLINYPNPFNPSTTIEFSIQNDSKVELAIFNIKGQKIRILTNNEFSKGSHSIIWNGDDDNGKLVSSGVYFYRLYVNGKTESVKKCLLLK